MSLETPNWLLYDATVRRDHAEFAGLVNDLSSMDLDHVYWLYATEPITPYLGVPVDQPAALGGFSNAPEVLFGQPPATYYGWVAPFEDFVPHAGMTIEARVDGQLCGQSEVVEWRGILAYKIQVGAEMDYNGCGALGRWVDFTIDGLPAPHGSAPWDNRQAQFHTLTYFVGPVYQHDFETPVGSGWDGCALSQEATPSGRGFLGRFGNAPACLSLENLPPHNWVKLAFDLFIIQSWNGNRSAAILPGNPFLSPTEPDATGPDIWRLLADGAKMLETTFSNMNLDQQSYPLWYPQGDHPPHTGASQVNSLGYAYAGLPMDAVYSLQFYFPHTKPDLLLVFQALGLQSLENESWGVDNLRIDLYDAPLYRLFMPLLY